MAVWGNKAGIEYLPRKGGRAESTVGVSWSDATMTVNRTHVQVDVVSDVEVQ